MIENLFNDYAKHNATDEELVQLFLESEDNRFFQQLYERYALKVYHKCLSLTRDAIRSEDLTHDVFLKLFSKMSTFREGAKFSTWLFSVTYNHCMDLMRVGKRRIITVNTEQIDLDREFDIDKFFDTDEIDSQTLRTALAQLNIEEKAMIYLKYLDDKSIREIAAVFRMTESAVKMRLMRSREKLRKKYMETVLFG